jgi:hypothetical protein
MKVLLGRASVADTMNNAGAYAAEPEASGERRSKLQLSPIVNLPLRRASVRS